MSRLVLALAILIAVPLAANSTMLDYEVPLGVVGCGGGTSSGWNLRVTGTVGQPTIGAVSDTLHTVQWGFWYQPGWIVTGVEDPLLPPSYSLAQNHPNPFNPVTTIGYSVPRAARVTMILYDVAGREVKTLVDEEMEPGRYSTVLDATGLSSGVYFCRMASSDFVASRKLVLLK